MKKAQDNELNKLGLDKSKKGTPYGEILMDSEQLSRLIRNIDGSNDAQENNFQVRNGVYDFEFNVEPQEGNKFYSDEIEIGARECFIDVRLTVEFASQGNNVCISGSNRVFSETEYKYDIPDYESYNFV